VVLLAASSAWRVVILSRSPTNFAGQWHCSQVSRAGRRLCTGDGMGRGYRPRVTEMSCQLPESFDFTNQPAPGPMWHSTQRTRACAERLCALSSGSMTLWHEPQKAFESITSRPLYEAAASRRTLTVLSPTKPSASARVRGRLKSRTGRGGSALPAAASFTRRLRASARPIGMSSRLRTSSVGRMTKAKMPM
jgi:hypothetical protein